jgi:hypothetical protein
MSYIQNSAQRSVSAGTNDASISNHDMDSEEEMAKFTINDKKTIQLNCLRKVFQSHRAPGKRSTSTTASKDSSSTEAEQDVQSHNRRLRPDSESLALHASRRMPRARRRADLQSNLPSHSLESHLERSWRQLHIPISAGDSDYERKVQS